MRLAGHDRVVVTSIGIYGIGDLKLSVSCIGGCLRIPGPIRVSRPEPGAKVFLGTNWVLAPGRAIRIAIYRDGSIGRYVILAATLNRGPALVFRRSGCLSGAARTIRCPAGTTEPKSGTPVTPVSAPPTSTTTSSTTSTTTSPSVSTFELSIARLGSGSGTVTGPDVSCGNTCTAQYDSGTTVTLSATPAAGSTFTGWGGPCSGTGTCTVVMSEAQSVAATFSLLPETLTIAAEGYGTGTVTGPGISCPGTCTMQYALGATVTLTASPGAGSAFFTGWGDACPSDPGGSITPVTCTLTLNGDTSVTATFSILGDLNADGHVDCLDLAILKSHNGQTDANYADGDLDGDGIVTGHDLSLLLTAYGEVAPGAPPDNTSSCSS